MASPTTTHLRRRHPPLLIVTDYILSIAYRRRLSAIHLTRVVFTTGLLQHRVSHLLPTGSEGFFLFTQFSFTFHVHRAHVPPDLSACIIEYAIKPSSSSSTSLTAFMSRGGVGTGYKPVSTDGWSGPPGGVSGHTWTRTWRLAGFWTTLPDASCYPVINLEM